MQRPQLRHLLCFFLIPYLSIAPAQIRDPFPLASQPRWKIEVFSNQVKNATAICFDDQGRLYVCETYRWRKGIEDNRDHTYWIMDDLASDSNKDRSLLYKKWHKQFEDELYFTRHADRVVRLDDTNGDGKADQTIEFAGGFSADVDGPAIGLLAGEGSIFLACIPHVWRLTDRDGDGKADQRVSLQDGFGVKNSLSGHDLHGLVWGPDAKLYFSMGDRGFHCKTKDGRILKDTNSGAVFRCKSDGTDLEIFYHGLRNPQEIAFNEYGDLFTVDNNCDQGDSARVCYLLEGGNTGWHLGTQALTTYKSFIDDGQFEQNPHWLSEGLWKLRFPNQPSHILPPIAHLTNGPSGLVFNSGTSLPDRYKNHFLVCDYKGAPNLCFLFSFKVQQQGAGYEMVDDHLVHAGIPNTDVEIGYDGKVYLADFGGGWVRSDQGNIYTLFDPDGIQRPVVAETATFFSEGFDHRDATELKDLMAHQDIRVRQRAQFALAKKGPAAIPLLVNVVSNSSDRFQRFHAIWALGQLNAGPQLVSVLDSTDAEIQAQAARTLGNIRFVPAKARVRELIDSNYPRLQVFAAIASGKLNDRAAFDSLIGLLNSNANKSVQVRHAAVFGLSRIAVAEQLAGLKSHDSAAIRLGAVLALRRKKSAAIASFLNDEDPRIVSETVRAINDAQIEHAQGPLVNFAQSITIGERSLPDENLYRRLLNAHLRLGTVAAAESLVVLAKNPSLPVNYRVLALKTLQVFDEPPSIDPTLGIYAPLLPRDASKIRTAIETEITKLFQASTGEMAAASIQVMSHYGLKLDKATIVTRIRDGRHPTIVRLTALQQLIDDKDFQQKTLMMSLLEDEDPKLRNGACRAFVMAFPNEATTVIRGMLKKEDDLDFRTAYDLLSTRQDDESIQILSSAVDQLLNGNLYRTVHLDLFEAIQANPSHQLATKRTELEQFLKEMNSDIYEFTLDGGDINNGRLVFQNQGVCLKCHKADHGGGDAGPDLTNIARLRRPHELLKSMLDPNETVVNGFGTQTFVLDDGTTVNGTLLERTKESIVVATPEGKQVVIPTETIEAETPLVSPMPKQAPNLSLREIRDLMAFLQSLKGQTE